MLLLNLSIGKFVPALSYRIHMENRNSPEIRIKLKGMAIGNGYSDPINMLNYGDHLYNIGLLDENERRHFRRVQKKARGLMLLNQCAESTKVS